MSSTSPDTMGTISTPMGEVYPPLTFPLPKETPRGVIHQIQCKVCPPPLGPEVANAQLKTVSSIINRQTNIIADLEQYVEDLEKRYVIRFDTKVSTRLGTITSGNVKGTLGNISLDFTLIPGPTGAQGPIGLPGPNGIAGAPGPIGPTGPTGYWGNIV